jgi:hypothetical protein
MVVLRPLRVVLTNVRDTEEVTVPNQPPNYKDKGTHKVPLTRVVCFHPHKSGRERGSEGEGGERVLIELPGVHRENRFQNAGREGLLRPGARQTSAAQVRAQHYVHGRRVRCE